MVLRTHLDRSDPAGTVWTAEAIKHLAPLLDRARLAGRVVLLTSDHGHIVERRQGQQRSHAVISSGRSRADGGPVGDGEVLVTGRRVRLHDGRAVLAVDERLRYGPLKAGYHGGASPAEVVIPLYFLVSGGQTDGTGLVPADQQVRQLLEALLAAPARRLPPTSAAVALGVAPATLRGAVLHAQRLLNVEGYAVLRLDVDGATVVLDETLLREQFEL